MTSYDIMLDWAQALLSDETLKAWIQDTFGRELAVRIGYDAVRSFSGPTRRPTLSSARPERNGDRNGRR